MEWISVKDRLPEIPEGKHGVSVIAAIFDHVYEELKPGHGYTVSELMFDGKFKDLATGPTGSDWIVTSDPVTHWMPMPAAPDQKP